MIQAKLELGIDQNDRVRARARSINFSKQAELVHGF